MFSADCIVSCADFGSQRCMSRTITKLLVERGMNYMYTCSGPAGDRCNFASIGLIAALEELQPQSDPETTL